MYIIFSSHSVRDMAVCLRVYHLTRCEIQTVMANIKIFDIKYTNKVSHASGQCHCKSYATDRQQRKRRQTVLENKLEVSDILDHSTLRVNVICWLHSGSLRQTGNNFMPLKFQNEFHKPFWRCAGSVVAGTGTSRTPLCTYEHTKWPQLYKVVRVA